MTYFSEWWADHGQWQIVPKNQGEEDRVKMVAKMSWSAATKRAWIGRFFLAVLLAALVLLAAFQSVEIMGHGARLDILEAPPEIVYRDIAIDPLAVESPMIYARHKVSFKYKTRAVYAAHNEEAKDNG